MDFQLIIFDCDGVLVDSEPRGNRLFVRMAADRGLTLDEEATLRDFNGLSIPARLDLCRERYGWVPADDFVGEFHHRITSPELAPPEPIPGVAEVLDGIAVPACVASNGIRAEIEQRVRIAGLEGRFVRYFSGAEDVARPKPAPDVYLHAAATMGVAPAHCAVIEDSLPGVQAARAAGMSVFGFARFTPEPALAGLGAIPFKTMAALPALLRAVASPVGAAE